MYRQLVRMIIKADTAKEMKDAARKIDKACDAGKITWNDHEDLMNLINRLGGKTCSI